jgi:hypothetical protein
MPQTGIAQWLDHLYRHHQDDDDCQQFCHAAFDQARAPLSKREL